MGWLFGRSRKKAEAGGESSFLKAAELAGFFAAHALWCVCEGETLIPLIGHEGPKGRSLLRLASERLEEGVEKGREWLARNPSRVARAALVYDGFFTADAVRTDALICVPVEYGPPRQTIEIILPYRSAKDERGFAVHRPKFKSVEGTGQSVTDVGAAFFRGVDAHAKGAAVWAKHLDESL